MLKKIINKLFRIEEWILAYSRASTDEFFRSKGKVLEKHQTISNNAFSFFADPFLIKIKNNKAYLFVENYSFFKGGRISFLEVDLNNNFFKQKIIISGGHYSFPFFLKKKNKFIILPEMSQKNTNLIFYIKNNKIIKKEPFFNKFILIDPVITIHNKLYWLFCSKKGDDENRALYVFYSKDLKKWTNVNNNSPAINNSRNCRSGGDIIKYKDSLYRPAQNCFLNYGKSLNINQIKNLRKNKYVEKKVFTIHPFNSDSFNQGIHHISLNNNYIFFDKKRYKYTPFKLIYKIFRFVNFL